MIMDIPGLPEFLSGQILTRLAGTFSALQAVGLSLPECLCYNWQRGHSMNIESMEEQSGENQTEVNQIGERMLPAGKPLSARHKELARLIFLGRSNDEIAAELKYTATRVSALRSNPQIQTEVARYQDAVFEKTISEKLPLLGPLAVNTLEQLLNDPMTKDSVKKDASIWILEKLTGKPKMETEGSDGFTLTDVHRVLDEIREDRRELAATNYPAPDTKPMEMSAAERWANTIPRETPY